MNPLNSQQITIERIEQISRAIEQLLERHQKLVYKIINRIVDQSFQGTKKDERNY